jgi:hypothetical protein
VLAGVLAFALFVAGAAGVALRMLTHRWAPTLAGLGVCCLGVVYAYAPNLGHPL